MDGASSGTPARVTQALRWREPVTAVRFVDAGRAQLLERLGIVTVGDLVRHFPRRYLDLSHTATLADVKVGSDATVVGTVHA